MDIHKLRVFCAVVETASFSLAGARLRLSQPVVSAHVKDLESAAGLPLLDRSKRPIRPTDAGKRLYEAALGAVGGMNEVERVLAEITSGEQGQVNLSATGIFGGVIIPPLVLNFRRMYPWIPVHVRRADSAQVLEQVAAGDSHIGLLLMQPPKSFAARTAGPVELVVVQKADGDSAEPESPVRAIQTKGLVAPSKGNRVLVFAEKLLHRYGVSSLPPVLYEVGSWEAAKRTVLQGTGVTILPRQWVAHELETRQLEELKFGREPLQIPAYVIHKRHRPLPRPVRSFRKFLIEELARIAPGYKRPKAAERAATPPHRPLGFSS